jgi:hypothetical protein
VLHLSVFFDVLVEVDFGLNTSFGHLFVEFTGKLAFGTERGKFQRHFFFGLGFERRVLDLAIYKHPEMLFDVANREFYFFVSCLYIFHHNVANLVHDVRHVSPASGCADTIYKADLLELMVRLGDNHLLTMRFHADLVEIV